jgi:hypothetical protein
VNHAIVSRREWMTARGAVRQGAHPVQRFALVEPRQPAVTDHVAVMPWGDI